MCLFVHDVLMFIFIHLGHFVYIVVICFCHLTVYFGHSSVLAYTHQSLSVCFQNCIILISHYESSACLCQATSAQPPADSRPFLPIPFLDSGGSVVNKGHQALAFLDQYSTVRDTKYLSTSDSGNCYKENKL